MNLKNKLLVMLTICVASQSTFAINQHSIARIWNEELLDAIRLDFARPTVHARNLYHTSAAMWDAWATYDATAKGVFSFEKINTNNIQQARNISISFAAYRLLEHRFANGPNSNIILTSLRNTMLNLGYDPDDTNLSGNSALALGNRIAQIIINNGLSDGSNEINDYANLYYQPINPPLIPALTGNPDIVDPNRWQPLALDFFIDQSGNLIVGGSPEFLSPEWGNLQGFTLAEEVRTNYARNNNVYPVYHDPGPPPYLGGSEDRAYKEGFAQVVEWSGMLDPSDGIMIDISPNVRGNNTLGTNSGNGYSENPITGLPYASNIVLAGDYYRVLAEFWADGPDSETPPGHWFTLANTVSDHPQFNKRVMGNGPVVSDLEWDVKMYLTLGGAMHDSAISAWSVKGWYDYIRPISAIRNMCSQGQSSDSAQASYSVNGIPLKAGVIELITSNSIMSGGSHAHLAGINNENVDKIAVKTWRGPDYINNPSSDTAGVGWILCGDWWPYQRPSFVTPPFAGYVSGHSTFSRAAAEVLTRLTGSRYFPGGVGTFVAPANNFLVFEEGPSTTITLQWASYQDAADECSLSRIYGGIHPTADDLPGRHMGFDIGNNAVDKAAILFGAGSVNSIPLLDRYNMFLMFILLILTANRYKCKKHK